MPGRFYGVFSRRMLDSALTQDNCRACLFLEPASTISRTKGVHLCTESYRGSVGVLWPAHAPFCTRAAPACPASWLRLPTMQKSHNLSSELEINGSEHALVASSPGNGAPCPRDLEYMYQRMRILHWPDFFFWHLDN